MCISVRSPLVWITAFNLRIRIDFFCGSSKKEIRAEPRNRPATSATRATLRGVQTGLDNDLDDEENQRMDHQRKDGGDEDEGIYGMQIEVNDNGNNGNRDGSGGGDDDDNDNDYYGSNTTAGSDNNHNNGSTPQIQFPPTLDPAVKNLHPRRGRRSLKRDADPCKESSPFTIVSAPNQSDVTGCYVQERRYNGEAMYVAQQQQEEGGVDASHGVIGAAQTDPEDRTHIHWSLVYTNTSIADSGKRSTIVCTSVDMAQNIHPADALWACDFDGKGSFFLTYRTVFELSCGCDDNTLGSTDVQLSEDVGGGSGFRYGGVVAVLGPLCVLAFLAKMWSPFCSRFCDKTFARRSLPPGSPTRTS